MDLDRYLSRIGFSGKVEPNLASLKALQRAHLFSTPFENLDIHIGREIILEPERVFDKIVNQHRGGFCYELNGLFYYLLKAHGFQVERIAAQVFDLKKGYGPPFDHLALKVTLPEGEVIADVGFGEYAMAPLALLMHTEQKDERGTFRMKPHNDQQIRIEKWVEGAWKPEYVFDLQSRSYEEYIEMCYYHQTSPDSHFTQNAFCSMATPTGRVTLTGDKMKFTQKEQVKEKTLSSLEEKEAALDTYFGIQLSLQA